MAGNYVIAKEYTFAAGHRLLTVPEGHQCRRVHGHTYKVRVEVSSTHLTDEGFVLEYGELSSIVKPLVAQFDHYLILQKGDPVVGAMEKLGEEIRVVAGPPTAEFLVSVFWDHLSRVIDEWADNLSDPTRVMLHKIVVWESPTSSAELSR